MYDYAVRVGDKTKPGLGVLSSDLKYKSDIILKLKV